jgi:predicted lipoprotein with Yx(FWY)xxD motif
MRHNRWYIFGAVIASAALLPAYPQSGMAQTTMSEPAKVMQGSGGSMLTDSKGMTLYTFDRDAGEKSACNGQCAQNWPPLMAGGDARPMGKWSVVNREDGSKQWAYAGKPLYTWSKDQKPGDTTGDGLNSVWHVARP